MPNAINYATQFTQEIMNKYQRELCTSGLMTRNVTFLNANTIKIPYVSMGGYKTHSRNGGFNRQSVNKQDMTKTLAFDRDVEFLVDTMDVDESNQVVSAANITNAFLEQQAIPETDAYNLSKLYADFTALTGVSDTTALTAANILTKFDAYMQQMDDAEVPQEGRIMYITPAVNTVLKSAAGITRNITSGNGGDNAINRAIRALDNVDIQVVPAVRMKTVYDFSDGWTPGVSAVQMNMILLHPMSVIYCDKHSYIRLWPEGTHTEGDGWLYQNRKYSDLFVIDTRYQGIIINKDA